MNKIKLIALTISILMLNACGNGKQDEKNKSSQSQAVETSAGNNLTTKLKERKDNFNKKADEATKKTYQEGLEAVENSGVVETAKNVGDMAPNFTLKNALGEDVSLNDYLAKGPVVLTWYRGNWCPYCNLTLSFLQEELPNFKAAGANLIALTPELPDQSISTTEKHKLEFEVLSDIDNHVADEYGIVFKLTNDVAEIYNDKFDLDAHNGNHSSELPLPATYIIDTDGKIVYAFLDADYRKRAEPKEITRILNDMKK